MSASQFDLERFSKMSAKELWNIMVEFTELINDAPNRREQLAREYEMGVLSNLHSLAKSREALNANQATSDAHNSVISKKGVT